MTLNQLLYFQKIAAMGNMGKAAKALHISQPSLSVSISNLEKELNLSLFHRNGHNLELSAEGCLLYTSYHLNIEEADPVESVRKYGYALQNLHLADSNRHAPGTGHFDFKAVAGALQEAGFDKYCSFEVFGLYPWKLWFDTVEEADRQMQIGIETARAAFNR